HIEHGESRSGELQAASGSSLTLQGPWPKTAGLLASSSKTTSRARERRDGRVCVCKRERERESERERERKRRERERESEREREREREKCTGWWICSVEEPQPWGAA